MRAVRRKRDRSGQITDPEPAAVVERESYDVTDDLAYDQLEVVSNPGAGDCLFHCFVRILDSISINKTVRDLREVVARSVGPRELKFLRDIYVMAEKARDVDILADYSFMRGVETVGDLRKAMMHSKYYGDEIAVTALERAFPVHCLILRLLPRKRIELARRYSEQEGQEKRWFSLLILDMESQHYELLKCNGQVVMRELELPAKIQRLLNQNREEREERRRRQAEIDKELPIKKTTSPFKSIRSMRRTHRV